MEDQERKRCNFIQEYISIDICEYNAEWDIDSQFLFNMHEWELDRNKKLVLSDYEFDKIYPEWKLVNTSKDDAVEVSNTGLVRDPLTKELYKINFPVVNGSPYYPIVNIQSLKDGQYYIQSVHRLVAQAFCDNSDPGSKTQVNHIDGNKDNNWYKNLEWVTPSENTLHAYSNGLRCAPGGENNPRHKYSDDQIRLACELLRDHPEMTYIEMEKRTGVDWTIIQSIYFRKRHRQVSEKYDFPPHSSKVDHRGEKGSTTKYSIEQINSICEYLSDPTYQTMTLSEIGKLVGVPFSTVSNIYNRRQWTNVSENFEFKPRLRSKENKE